VHFYLISTGLEVWPLTETVPKEQHRTAFRGLTHRTRFAVSQPFALTIRASASNH